MNIVLENLHNIRAKLCFIFLLFLHCFSELSVTNEGLQCAQHCIRTKHKSLYSIEDNNLPDTSPCRQREIQNDTSRQLSDRRIGCGTGRLIINNHCALSGHLGVVFGCGVWRKWVTAGEPPLPNLAYIADHLITRERKVNHKSFLQQLSEKWNFTEGVLKIGMVNSDNLAALL